MQLLRGKTIFFGISLFIGAGACCYLVFQQRFLMLYILLIPVLVVAVYFYRQLQRLRTARLITENSILSIPVVTVWNSDSSSLPNSDKTALVIVSCFGIIFDNEVFKFNCDGIRLLSVAISWQAMWLTFGTEKKKQHVRLLHGLSNREDIQMITEKFRYETGVIPVVAGREEE